MYFTNNAIAPYNGKRRLDRRSRRYNDGIKDFFVKIKQKAHELITYFKQLPNSKKIVLVLSQILKLVSVLYAKKVALKSKMELAGPKFEVEIYKNSIIESKKDIDRYVEKISKLKNELEILWKERSTTYDGSEGGRIWRATINGVARPKLERLVGQQENLNAFQSNVIESLKSKEEAENKIKSIETKASIKIFISLLTVFLSSVVDYFALHTSKTGQLARRDSANNDKLRDSLIKYRIDKAVRKYVRLALKDAGVQGMKKGQHVKARDPEYVESLRNGGGAVNSGDGNQPKQNGMGIGKKIALGAGGAAALLGAGLLGHKLGVKRGAREMAKVARKKIREQKEVNNQRVFNAIKNAVNG